MKKMLMRSDSGMMGLPLPFTELVANVVSEGCVFEVAVSNLK